MIPPRARLRSALLAIAAALAMLVQAMIGSAAMAAPASHTIQVCAEHGLKTITVSDAPGKQPSAPCPHCEHCLASAVTTPVRAVQAIQPVRYAEAIAAARPAPALSPYAARAPPRPPGQAPPLS